MALAYLFAASGSRDLTMYLAEEAFLGDEDFYVRFRRGEEAFYGGGFDDASNAYRISSRNRFWHYGQ